MNALVQRIADLENRFDSIEPEIMAFVPEEGRFERLRADAAHLEKRFPDSQDRPPLFGLLAGVKDIFRVAGFPTRAGSRLPADTLAGPESTAAARLKANGALIVGKTVTTEFAYFGPGPTRNPQNPAYTPGGSSSGSAAAVAAELCEIALGTQTIGSVNRPAAFCGVCGYKPSYDRIPKDGVIPLAGSFDHIGIFAPGVGELDRIAAVLADRWQPAQANRPVLGVPTGPYLDRAEEIGRSIFQSNLDDLAAAGFDIREIPLFSDFEMVYERHQKILAAEAARVHAAWFAEFGDRYHPKTADLVRRGMAVSDADLAAALAELPAYRQSLLDAMADSGIHAWITPSAPGPAPRGLDSTGDPVMNLPWTQAGLPTLTIPSGAAPNGLPLGLQLVGGWYADELLVGWGRHVESAILPYNS